MKLWWVKDKKISSLFLHGWLSSLRTGLHVYVLLCCNTVVRGLADVYARLPKAWGRVWMCLWNPEHIFYNTYVTLSLVMYSIACKYPGISTLQVRYYAARSYHIGLTSQKLRKRWDSWNVNNNATNLLALAHVGSLEFDSIHVGWLFIEGF